MNRLSKRKRRKKPAKTTAATRSPAQIDAFDWSGVLRRVDIRNALIVAGVALAVRLIFFFLYKNNNPLFYHPIMDAKYHHEWALEILSGNFWGDDVFFRAPLYPYFLAFLYKISGSSIALAVFFQQLIGTGTAVVIYLLARQFFLPRVSILAGLAAALYWPFIYFEGDLLIVTLIVFLDALGLLLLVMSMRADRGPLFVVSGLLLGLSAIARPNILIILPTLVVAFYLYNRNGTRNSNSNSKLPTWLRQTLVVYAATAVVIAPVIIRNYVVGRDIVPIASQGGVNFFIGNNAESDGRTAIVPGTRWDWWGGYEDAIAIAEQARGRSLKPSEVSDYYFERAFVFILGSPDESIPLLARKFGLFWGGGERSNNKYIYFFWHKSGLGKVPLPGFWLIAPLGLAGAVLLWPRRREFLLLYLFVASYMVGVIAFFVNARFRLPVVPVLIVFAAYAAFALWQTIRQRNAGGWKTIVLVTLCFLAVDLDFIRFRENKVHADSLSHYTLGNAYLKMGLSDKAIDEYEEAVAVYKRYPNDGYRLIARNVDFNLGKLYHAKQLCSRAVPYLERVGGNDQFAYLSQRYLAECYTRLGRFSEATDTFRRMLAAQPNDTDARRGMIAALTAEARSYEQVGDRARALDVLNRAQTMFPGEPSIRREIDRLQSGP